MLICSDTARRLDCRVFATEIVLRKDGRLHCDW